MLANSLLGKYRHYVSIAQLNKEDNKLFLTRELKLSV